LPFGVERLPVVLLQNPGVSVDGPQRGAEVVRDGVGERLEIVIARFERAVALLDLALG